MRLLTIRNRHFHSVQHKNYFTSRGTNIQIKDSLPKHILLSYKYHLKFDRFSICVLSISCLFHLWKQPLLIGEMFIVLKSVVHMFVYFRHTMLFQF